MDKISDLKNIIVKTLDTNKAQNKMALIQGQNNIYFAGAWLGYGFHEDGIKSAVKVAKLLQAKIPWEFK